MIKIIDCVKNQDFILISFSYGFFSVLRRRKIRGKISCFIHRVSCYASKVVIVFLSHNFLFFSHPHKLKNKYNLVLMRFFSAVHIDLNEPFSFGGRGSTDKVTLHLDICTHTVTCCTSLTTPSEKYICCEYSLDFNFS